MHPQLRPNQPTPLLLGWTTTDDGQHPVTVPDTKYVLTPRRSPDRETARGPAMTGRTIVSTPLPPSSTSTPR
jgi:hypothetical protein